MLSLFLRVKRNSTHNRRKNDLMDYFSDCFSVDFFFFTITPETITNIVDILL